MAAHEATATDTFAQPSEERARHYMREVGYDDRLGGIIMKASGTQPVTLYSLVQVLGFLVKDNSQDTVPEGEVFLERYVEVSYIDPSRLSRWIREVVGDTQLADAIDAAVDVVPESKGYPPRMRAARDLINQRLWQCARVLKLEEPEDVPAEDSEYGKERDRS